MRLIALVIALLVSPLRAGAVDDAGKTEARRHFKHGAELIQRGSYRAALEEFEAAYRLFPNERLHFDIAQAYRLIGDKQAAIDHYRRYLAAIDVGENADDARRQLVALGAPPVVAEPVAPPPSDTILPPSAVETDAVAPVDRAASAVVPAAPAPASIVVAAPAPARAAARKPLARRPWLWITVGGVVLAGAGVGLALGLTVGARYPQASLGTITVPQH